MVTSSRAGLDRRGLVVATLVLAVVVGVVGVECHGDGHGRRSLGLTSRVASLVDEAGPWNNFKLLLDAGVGDVRTGLATMKSYLLQFGYIPKTEAPALNTNFSDTFDNITETAVRNYQLSFGIPVTGRLDVRTLTQMIIPRCGREDVINGTLIMLQNGLNAAGTQHVSVGTRKWSSFSGNPRWMKKNLTYAIDTTRLTTLVSQTDIEIAIDTAFAQWAAVTELNFTRIQTLNSADITISFDLFDHNDMNSFDGQLGVLAHAFAPTDGRLHFDNSESWSVDVRRAGSTSTDFDLVSVAVHEIGHIIGLEHSQVPDSIMYPSISPLSSKQALAPDDILGAQTLYGANPAYNPGNTPPGTVGNQGAAVASWRHLRAMDLVTTAAALSCAGFALLLTGSLS